jgi:polyribonucleotide nucleotidyltransferase
VLLLLQIISTLQSFDGRSDPVSAAVNSASAALMVSDIPWAGPVGCVRIGKIGDKLVVNPDLQELTARGTLDLLYAANKVSFSV